MSTKTSIRIRVSKAEGLTIAYTLGQLTQLFLHWMCLENNLYVYRQILFCSIAGAVLLVAIIIGTVIGSDAIPEYWKKPIGDELDTYVRDLKKISIRELAAKTAKVAASLK